MNYNDELGAHVSTSGGIQTAPSRAALLNATVLQLFTKRPAQWQEPDVNDQLAHNFINERFKYEIRTIVSHDSYLINLATPTEELLRKSINSFRMEVKRCNALGIEYIVTHPGNATDKNRERGLIQNAKCIGNILEEEGGSVVVLLETTAGQGNVLGKTFEEIAEIRKLIPTSVRERVGVCLDTCHIWAAGYDLKNSYEETLDMFDTIIGINNLKLFHLNDSQGEKGTSKDRHAGIGLGTLGDDTFKNIVLDSRFKEIPKILETPKGDDETSEDIRNLEVLRNFRLIETQI